MPATVIDGRAIAAEVRKELSVKVNGLKSKGTEPTLAVIHAGSHEPSDIYLRMKEKAADEIGISIRKHRFRDPEEKEILERISNLNADISVHGILVQLPLPRGLDEDRIISSVSPEKDVDGFHPSNTGSLASGNEGLVPCTPLGIIRMIESTGIPVKGRHAVIVNHTRVIGRPLAMLLLNRGATVTICNEWTGDLGFHTRTADILVTAAGVPGLIGSDMVKDGATVIDAGITRSGSKVTGDVDFDDVKQKAAYISPVPGGVGPMTVAMAMSNTCLAAESVPHR